MRSNQRKSGGKNLLGKPNTAEQNSAATELAALRKQLLEIIVRREQQRKNKPK